MRHWPQGAAPRWVKPGCANADNDETRELRRDAVGREPSTVNPSALTDPRFEARALVRRHLFGTFAVVGALATLLPLWTDTLSTAQRLGLALGFGLLALFSAAAHRSARLRGDAAMVAICFAGVTLVAAAALMNGWGLNAPAMGSLALFTLLVGATVSPRLGLAIGAASALVLAGLAWAEHQHWIRGAVALADAGLPRRLVTHLVLLGVGLLGGVLVTRVFGHYLGASRERELRFQGLLGVAADSYWEMDTDCIVTAVWRRDGPRGFAPVAQPGQRPWEQPDLLYDDGALAAHRADLDARRPFRDLHIRWRRADGTLRHEFVSGEPRFGADGRFLGYWGVSRDVTDDINTRRALQQTEARYHELFAMSPLALVIHRDWRVLDANPAALALFGYPDLAAMRGEHLLAHLNEADQARSHDRLARLCRGERLPTATFTGTMRDGRHVTMNTTAARVDQDSPPAVLSVYDDVTDRIAAEEALRRSETLLSHLFSTSPELITLSDFATGRYLMVNEAFTRYFGHTAEEAIGRTSVELGIWWSGPSSRDELVRRVRAEGVVSDMPMEYISKSGRHFSLRISGASFALDGAQYLVVTGRDVTAAEGTRLAHDAVLANASLGIGFTREGRFVQANPALEKMLGWPSGTLAGQAGRVVWRSDAEHAAVGALIDAPLERGESVEFTRELRRHDGCSLWCRLLAKAVDPTHPLRGGTIWIIEDITERRRTEQALSKARDDAEAASRAKSAFLANTSHEIRTPLNGLVGLARLLRRDDLDATRRRQYLDQIGDSAETLSALISDVLDLSKIEAGKLGIERVGFDLHALLDSLRRVYGTLSDARGLSFVLALDAAVPAWVSGDPVRVRQVLGNYLNNALKFTTQGEVALHARALGGGRLRFEVVDSGIGIEPAVQARLFHPFTQADESTTRRFGGSGLGLSICRELATLMEGSVGLTSTPGVGSCFWVELLLPAAPAQIGRPEATASARLRGMRVLVAEDNPVNTLIAVAMLEQWGVRVTEAADGAQALAAVARAQRAGTPFDAVLMDVQMPVMSGYEATRRLREQYDAEALPIIALTAAALTSERDRALAVGMSAFLTKPIDVQRLHDTLLAALDAAPAS